MQIPLFVKRAVCANTFCLAVMVFGWWALPAQAAIHLPAQAAQAPLPAASGAAPEPGQERSLRTRTSDMEQVMASLLASAASGDVDAMLRVGLYYYTNAGLPQAGANARLWLARAAQGGDVRAMAAYAYLLGSGTGGPRNLASAREWLAAARESGFARATYIESLLEAHITGPKKMQEARRLLEQAARDGDALAMNDLAVELELDGSPDRAREMYVLAAAQGHSIARANYMRIERQTRSSEAARLARLRTLADDGNADGLLQLAQMYHKGQGVQRDFAQAIQLYRRAADAGSKPAREFLALVFSRTSKDNRGFDTAWMEELAARVNAKADAKTVGDGMVADRPRRSDDPLWNLAALRWTPRSMGSEIPVDE